MCRRSRTGRRSRSAPAARLRTLPSGSHAMTTKVRVSTVSPENEAFAGSPGLTGRVRGVARWPRSLGARWGRTARCLPTGDAPAPRGRRLRGRGGARAVVGRCRSWSELADRSRRAIEVAPTRPGRPPLSWVVLRPGPGLAPAGVREPPAGDVDRRRDLVAVVHVADPGGTVLVVSKPHGAVGHPVQGQGSPQPDAERTSGLEVHDRLVHGAPPLGEFIIVKL